MSLPRGGVARRLADVTCTQSLEIGTAHLCQVARTRCVAAEAGWEALGAGTPAPRFPFRSIRKTGGVSMAGCDTSRIGDGRTARRRVQQPTRGPTVMQVCIHQNSTLIRLTIFRDETPITLRACNPGFPDIKVVVLPVSNT